MQYAVYPHLNCEEENPDLHRACLHLQSHSLLLSLLKVHTGGGVTVAGRGLLLWFRRQGNQGLFGNQKPMAEPQDVHVNGQQNEQCCNECRFLGDCPQFYPLGYARQCPEVSHTQVLTVRSKWKAGMDGSVVLLLY